MSLARSVLAVLAGIVVLTLTSFAIEAAVKPMLPLNGAGMPTGGAAWLITLSYTLLCVVAGGYATARLARSAPVAHAVAMGTLEALMTVGVWMSMPALLPAWRWIAGIALIVPAAWLGGTISRARATARS